MKKIKEIMLNKYVLIGGANGIIFVTLIVTLISVGHMGCGWVFNIGGSSFYPSTVCDYTTPLFLFTLVVSFSAIPFAVVIQNEFAIVVEWLLIGMLLGWIFRKQNGISRIFFISAICINIVLALSIIAISVEGRSRIKVYKNQEKSFKVFTDILSKYNNAELGVSSCQQELCEAQYFLQENDMQKILEDVNSTVISENWILYNKCEEDINPAKIYHNGEKKIFVNVNPSDSDTLTITARKEPFCYN